MTGVVVLEHVTRVTPLGVRFRDLATDAFVSWGIAAEVYPEGQPEIRRSGLVNRADVFVFNNLPSLRDVEFGRGDDAYWAAQTPRYPFVLDVRDNQSRYLPFTLSVTLPVRRLLGFLVNSPLSSPLTVQASSSTQSLPLFSAPSRPAPDGMGVLRAEIVDVITGEPAAWAVLEARGPGQPLATGMADEAGRVMLPVPYPKPIVTLASPGSPAMPLTGQAWPVDFTVRYRRRTPVPLVPDLADVLTQPPATSWRDTAATVPLAQTTLRFGRDGVIASLTGLGLPSPNLLITPAVSPP
jgi:hypothetical protein